MTIREAIEALSAPEHMSDSERLELWAERLTVFLSGRCPAKWEPGRCTFHECPYAPLCALLEEE